MTDFTLNPDHLISDEQSLRAAFPPTHELAIQKCLDKLDPHAQAFIKRSPFLCLGTQNADGKADVSPRGDPAGFVQILDPQTLAIPDRPGNNRLDSLSNIVANPSVGLLFIIPGFEDTLRINGRASLTKDPDLLAKMQVNDRTPTLAIIVQIDTIFMHCAKAFRRSRLWDVDHMQDRKDMASFMQIVTEQSTGAVADKDKIDQLDVHIEESYRKSMY